MEVKSTLAVTVYSFIIQAKSFIVKHFLSKTSKIIVLSFFLPKTAICCKDGKFNPIFYPTLFSLF
jgi:hypothetical protein